MIKPHGSDKLNPLYVLDDKLRAELTKEAEGLPSIVVSSAAAANAVMMGGGYFNPLTGYINGAYSIAVADKMWTHGGRFFPGAVVNAVPN
ncbi:MAG: sulfate adenylyltransferase, partial [Deltaproteobacteria bacterium]|nr:sulfate adenylyltransferase [Deltaproteobacteria bacterium]